MIIILCIILLLIVWIFYFTYMREGLDPKEANYTMPISFSGEKTSNSEKIKIPQFIETNNNQPLSLVNETNMMGHVRIPKNTPIEFGAGETKEVNAGKITYGTWDDKALCIVGGGGAAGQGTRKVHVWDDLIVNNDLNVTNNLKVNNTINTGGLNTDWQNVNWLNVNHGDINIKNGHGISTNWLNVGNSTSMRGMQAGTNWQGRDNGYIDFNPWFSTRNVFVLITKINGEQSRDMVTYTAYNISEKGFNYRQAATYQGSNWAYVTYWPGYAFNWVAFALG